MRKQNVRGRLNNGAPNPIDVYVGKRVREIRVNLGLSQENLSAMIGISFQQVQKYERGANRIGASRLWDLACALHVSPSSFFEGMDHSVTDYSPVRLQNAASYEPPEQIKMPHVRATLEHMKRYNGLSEISRQAVDALMQALTKEAA